MGSGRDARRLQWVRVDQPLELKVRNRNFRLIWVEPRDESPADAFPDPPDKLQPLAGAWTWPDESGQSGEQIVGDLWEDPFVHGDDPYRPSDQPAPKWRWYSIWIDQRGWSGSTSACVMLACAGQILENRSS